MGDASTEKWTVRTDGVVWRRVGDDVILMDLGPSVYHSLRGVGAEVWQLLSDGPRSLADLVGALHEEYEVDVAVLRTDLEVFLHRLREAGLANQV